MKIILAMVASVDGKTTKWNEDNLHSWTSKEDQEYFSRLIAENNLIIMGRKTYDAAKKQMHHLPGKLRVILTKNPEQYNNEAILDQLEFTQEHIAHLIKRLEQKGFKEALLVGGAEINSMFLKEKLVNELWLTIEPKLFGMGNNITGIEPFDINLKLLSVEKLNPQGTLLLKYSF